MYLKLFLKKNFSLLFLNKLSKVNLINLNNLANRFNLYFIYLYKILFHKLLIVMILLFGNQNDKANLSPALFLFESINECISK